MRRTTCLYCETSLVPAGGTLNCPVCSADFIRRSSIPAGWALIRKVTPEQLAQGRPNSRPL